MPPSLPHEALVRAVRAAFGADAQVVASEPLVGDASTRRYVRLRLSGAGAPPTAVAMLLGERVAAGASEELGGGVAARELPFTNVARYLTRHGLPVPTIFHDAAAADGLLLLEDLGDTTLWRAVERDPAAAPALFGAAVDLLVRLQSIGARHPDADCHAFERRFDGALARAELAHFIDHGIETRHESRLTRADRDALLSGLEPLVAPFTGGPAILAHRDYMAWNLHVCDGRLVLIDFQDALLAPEAFDLAQLLTDRTTATVLGPALEESLIDRFVTGRGAAGLPAAADLRAAYHRCVLQHACKVIGRFYFLERVKGKPGYLAYLPSVYAVARRAFDAMPELGPVRERLVAYVPELGSRAP